MNTRRIAVSFLNAFEIPFAVIAGVNYNTNPLISLVCVIVAAACAYGYTHTNLTGIMETVTERTKSQGQ